MIQETKLRPSERESVKNSAIICKQIEDKRIDAQERFEAAVEKLREQYGMDAKSEKIYNVNLEIIRDYMGEEATPDDIVEMKISIARNKNGEYERKTYVAKESFLDATTTRRTKAEESTETEETTPEEAAAEPEVDIIEDFNI